MSADAGVPGEARTIFFAVDSTRLLGESRRFFRSVPDALTELVQNAYRAGARHLRVWADRATRTITFADDGRGLDDPARLVTFAGSDWPASVVEPAGIGAFALVGVSESVHIRSVYGYPARAWSLAIGADVIAAGLADQPLSVCPELVEANTPSGFTVTAVLRQDQPWPSFESAELNWRHLFPLSMTLTVDGIERRLDAPAIPAVLRLETPVGRLSVLQGNVPSLRSSGFLEGHRRAQLLPVWEHRAAASAITAERLLGGGETDARMHAIIRALTYDPFVHSEPCSFVWEVDAACGVRPQLPDRNAMLEDEALHGALRVIRDFIFAAVDVEGLTALFRRLAGEERRIEQHAFRKRIATDPVAQAHRLLGAVGLEHLDPAPFLATAGYDVIRTELVPSEASFSVDRDDDSWQCTCDHGGPSFYVRPTHRFALPAMLVGLGEAMGEARESAAATVRLACTEAKYVPKLALLLTTGLRVETFDGTVLRALPVFWNGPGDTFLMADVGLDIPDAGDVVGVVNVTSWETAFASLRGNDDFRVLAIAAQDAGLVGVGELGDYVECEWSDYTINEQRLASDALAEVGAVLGGEAALVAGKVAHLESLRSEMMPRVLTSEQIEQARGAQLPEMLLEAMVTLRAAQQAAREAFGLAERAVDARLAA